MLLVTVVRSAPASLPPPSLGQGEGADLLSPRQRGHEPPLLALGAEHADELGRQRQVGGVYGAGGGAPAGDLLDGNSDLAHGAAAAAVLLVDAQAEEAKLREPPDVVPREVAALVVGGGPGRKLPVRELPDGTPQQGLIFFLHRSQVQSLGI